MPSSHFGKGPREAFAKGRKELAFEESLCAGFAVQLQVFFLACSSQGTLPKSSEYCRILSAESTWGNALGTQLLGACSTQTAATRSPHQHRQSSGMVWQGAPRAGHEECWHFSARPCWDLALLLERDLTLLLFVPLPCSFSGRRRRILVSHVCAQSQASVLQQSSFSPKQDDQ